MLKKKILLERNILDEAISYYQGQVIYINIISIDRWDIN